MNVTHVTIAADRFECKRCGTAHIYMLKLWGSDLKRKASLFLAQHGECTGPRQCDPLPFAPAAPSSNPRIRC